MNMLYIDATSGGMILQVLLSGVVGSLVVVKLFWRNLTDTIFRRKRAKAPAADEAVEQDG
jgi:hypothetical protein